MAEGLPEGLLGGEGEAAAGEGRIRAEALAAAVAADQAKLGPDVALALEVFLVKQARLIDAQAEEIAERRALRQSLVSGRLREGEIRRVGQRIRTGLQAFAALVLNLVALALIAAPWSAAHDQSLVVEPFSVPPDFVQRGLTGQVVARQVRDWLSNLQAQTETIRASDTYQNNWGEDLRVEGPETRLSLGDWLGRKTRISGEIYRTPTGLTLTARAGAEPPRRLSGPEADYDKLIQQAAEALYRRTQPYRYAIFLQEHGRKAEAPAVLQEATGGADPVERAWAYVGLSNAARFSGRLYEAIQDARRALDQVHGFAPAIREQAQDLEWLGHDEAAAKTWDEMAHAGRSIGDNFAAGGVRETAIASAIASRCELVGDDLCALRQITRMEAYSAPAVQQSTFRARAQLSLLEHAPASALSDAQGLSGPVGELYKRLYLGRAALMEGDRSSVAELSQLEITTANSTGPDLAARLVGPWLALARARFGDLAGAQQLAAALPTACYTCLRVKAMVAAQSGDRPGALRWLAEAMRQNPELPQAYDDRAEVRLGWGDVSGALADAADANRLSPHYPDALKLWGDALAREGEWKAALAKYDEARKYAPAWAELNQARDAAARKA